MNKSPFKMRFDPQTIKHLGVRMYSTLPPALAEIVSNSYDADAKNVTIKLIEKRKKPDAIIIIDDGTGMSYDDILKKFLVIGRNRRMDDGDNPSEKYKRLPIGKKGLGKLALFGLATTIIVRTVKNKILNELKLDWNDLMAAKGIYRPKAKAVKQIVNEKDGTIITLQGLKRKTSYDVIALRDSLSRLFIFDKNFNLFLKTSSGDKIKITNETKYESFEKEFTWEVSSTLFIPESSEYYKKIKGKLFTSLKPISPSSGLRGVTLFSRGKLVNAPEYFSTSTSSHFYQYLTGWISVDFIDLLNEDVISTNRQSIDWEHPDMEKLRNFLSGIISQINNDWRKKRKAKKEEKLKDDTGINTQEWIRTLPDDIKRLTTQIIETLGGEDAIETYTPVVKALHEIVPEYPRLHWRNLHSCLKDISRQYYIDENYYTAFLESVKKYVKEVEKKSEVHDKAERELMGNVFSLNNKILNVVNNYKQKNGTDFSANTIQNIQEAQHFLSQGVIVGGRHPISHEEIVELKESDLFSEKDCLDMLSLLSHLFKRLDNAVKS